MPVILRATATINHKSGIPEDASRNVWHFACATPLNSTERAALGTAVGGFYTAIANRFGYQVASAANAHKVEIAEVTSDLTPGGDNVVTPILNTVSFTADPGAGNGGLPGQVACVMSFRGDLTGAPEESGATRPASRRRGRIYIGPMGTNSLGEGANGEPIINTATREQILDAYDSLDLAVQNIGLPTLAHSVFSRVGHVAYNVVSVSIDNSFDVQRRRKVKRTARMTRAIDLGTAQTGRNSTDVALAS